MPAIHSDIFEKKILPNIEIGEPCWNWKQGADKDGYGRSKLSNRGWRAHRLSFMAWFGINPGPLCVLHSCDNPSCVRPDHLRLGSIRDNNAERDSKGRQVKGSIAFKSRLNEAQVRSIHAEYNPSTRLESIAHKYGIAINAVWCILTGRSWKHLNLAPKILCRPGRPRIPI